MCGFGSVVRQRERERKKEQERCMDGVANQGVYVRTKVNAEQSQRKSQCEQ